MNKDEVAMAILTIDSVLFRVFATARPGHEDFMEFRFPGLTRTGYFIENGLNILSYADWLDIERVEKW